MNHWANPPLHRAGAAPMNDFAVRITTARRFDLGNQMVEVRCFISP
jgi:hypothetical protein